MKGDSTESGGQSTNPFFDEEDEIGTIHLRRQHFLGGEGAKNCQICRRIVVKKMPTGEGPKSNKICRRLKWMFP